MKASRVALLTCILLVFSLTLSAQWGPGGVGNEDDSKEDQPELVIWLRADRIAASDGAPIDRWSDESGNDHHAEKGDPQGPLFQLKGMKGHPCLNFHDGSWLKVPEKTNLDGGPGIAVFVVLQPQSIDQGAGMKMITKRNHWNLWGAGLTKETCQYSFNLDFHGRDGDQYVMAHVNGNLPGNKVETAAIYGDTSRVLLVNYNYTGAVSAVRVNGANTVGKRPNPNFAVGDLGPLEDYDNEVTIGAGKYQPTLENEDPVADFLDAKVAEVILYRQGLDSTAMLLVENYLAVKYGLDIGEDLYYQDSLLTSNLIGIGSKHGTQGHLEASNGVLGIAALNESIDSAGEFAFWADNDAAIEWTSEEVPEGWDKRWTRTWKYEKMGEIDLQLTFNFLETGLPLLKTREYTLLYKARPEDAFVPMEWPHSKRFGTLTWKLDHTSLPGGYYTVAEGTSSTFSEEFREGAFSAYPNPFSECVHVDVPGWAQVRSIRLMDLCGRTLRAFPGEPGASVLRLDLGADVPLGAYILLVEHQHGCHTQALLKTD